MISSMRSWAEQHGLEQTRHGVKAKRQPVPAIPKHRPEWRDMTDDEVKVAAALSPSRVTYPVASPLKRLAQSLSHQAIHSRQITENQAAAMWNLAYRFRRQLPAEIIAMARTRQDVLNACNRLAGNGGRV